MKKILAVIIVLILLIGGVLFFVINKGGISLSGSAQYEIENVIPENPILYLEFKNIGKNIDKLSQTPFWKRMMAVDFDAMFSGGQSGPQQQMIAQMVKKFFENPKENEIFNKFFSKDIAVVLYEPNLDLNALSQAGPEGAAQLVTEELLSKVYFVTRLDAQAQLTEFITSAVGQLGENVSIEDEQYKDQEIKVVSIQGIPYKFVYARVKDLMIMSVGKFPVQQSIDASLGTVNSLAKDKNYLLARNKFIKNPEMKTFFNTEGFFSTIETKLAELPEMNGIGAADLKKQLEPTLSSIKGFKSANISTAWTDLIEIKLDIVFDMKTMNSALAKYYASCQNEGNQSVNFAPSNTLTYVWVNCLDLNYYWEETKKEMELAAVPGQPSASEQIAQYEQMIGLRVEEDILPAFGDEMGGFIKDIHVDRNFPIPELLVYIKIKDQAKAERLLELLKNQPVVALQNENYNGVNLNYISLPIAEYVSPGYCFLNDYLLISVNKELLKGSVDASKNNATTLASNASFKILNKGLTDKNIGMQFYKVDEFAFKFASVLEWSNSWMVANDQKKEAFKDGAKLRLTQVQKQIEEEETALKEAEQSMKDIETKIKEMETAGQDASAEKTRLQELNSNISGMRQDIEANVQEAMSIEDTINAYSTGSGDTAQRKAYFDHVVVPLIDSFKTIEGIGVVSTMSSDALETKMFMKL